MSEFNQEAVLALVREQVVVGAPFTARDLKKVPEGKFHSAQNHLWNLSRKGFLDKPRGKGTKGVYILRGRKASQKKASRKTNDPEQVIIDELLDCMARAEPILKKWSKLREDLKAIV
jgi:hypothetical protein